MRFHIYIECVSRGEHKTFHHGATIAYKGKLVAVGWNKNKTHPKSTDKYKFIHAEMDAMIKAGTKARGATLYVARVHKNGCLANSKPCPACHAMALAYGVKEIYYIAEDSWQKIQLY